MKKTVFIIITLMFQAACGTLKTVTVDRLQMGMSRADVENIVGQPEKKLLASLTEFGYQEILAYNIGNDLYTLEFMNDRLIRYEFLRGPVNYIPPRPPIPPREIYPVRPEPVTPPPATKPSPPPSTPPVNPGRPQQENAQQERPSRTPNSESANQAQPSESKRPVTTETKRQGRGSENSQQSRRSNRSSVETNQSEQNVDTDSK